MDKRVQICSKQTLESIISKDSRLTFVIAEFSVVFVQCKAFCNEKTAKKDKENVAFCPHHACVSLPPHALQVNGRKEGFALQLYTKALNYTFMSMIWPFCPLLQELYKNFAMQFLASIYDKSTYGLSSKVKSSEK